MISFSLPYMINLVLTKNHVDIHIGMDTFKKSVAVYFLYFNLYSIGKRLSPLERLLLF